jgi:hypothetical protein
MPKIKLQSGSAVAETLLIPLYARALEASDGRTHGRTHRIR